MSSTESICTQTILRSLLFGACTLSLLGASRRDASASSPVQYSMTLKNVTGVPMTVKMQPKVIKVDPPTLEPCIVTIAPGATSTTCTTSYQSYAINFDVTVTSKFDCTYEGVRKNFKEIKDSTITGIVAGSHQISFECDIVNNVHIIGAFEFVRWGGTM